MKTGVLARVRSGASVGAANILAVSLPFVLTACDDYSPVAATTSTLPAQDSADGSSNESESPSVPDYEAELDLKDEEAGPVDQALVEFEGIIQLIAAHFQANSANRPTKSVEKQPSGTNDSQVHTSPTAPNERAVDP